MTTLVSRVVVYIRLTTKDKTAETTGRYVNQSLPWILGPLQLVPNKGLQKKISPFTPHFVCSRKTRNFSLFPQNFASIWFVKKCEIFAEQKMKKFCEKMWNLKKFIFLREFIKKTKYSYAKFRFVFAFFAFFIFAKKLAQCEQNFRIFFPKRLVPNQ